MKRLEWFLFIGLLSLLTSCGFLYGAPETKTKAVSDISQAGWEVTPFEFTNQFNQTFGTEKLEGQYWIANMIFAKCPTICTVMTPNMILLQDEVAKKGINVQFVSFTVDPDFDSPQVLKAYGEAYGANFENYHFLTGYSQEFITDFARDSFKSLVLELPDSDDIMHSVNFFLVDGKRNVVRIYNGDTDFDVKAIVKDLKSTVR